MRLMGKRGQAGCRQFAQIAVIKAHDTDIFRHMETGIGKFFDQPVSDFVIVTDNGGTGTQISLDKVRQESGVLFFLETDELLCREPCDRILVDRKPGFQHGACKSEMAFLPLNRVELEDARNLAVFPFYKKPSERKTAGIIIVFYIGTGWKIGIIAMKKYNVCALGGEFFIQIKIRRREAGAGRLCNQSAQRRFGEGL